ncbi:MAG: hypothetical protein HRT45_19410 [Bdellovibrionales bacterium]|nr:hypothetical protein [Bdellovibrionales bacterium]
MNQQDPLKRLTYRDSTKVLYKIAIGISLIAVLIIIRQRVVHYMDVPFEQTILKLVLACSVPFSVLMRLYFWVRPRIYSIYEVHADSFVRVYRNQREINKYDDVARIKISLLSPRFFGGFSVYMNNGKKTHFLSALKNSHKLLELMVEKRPGLVEKQQFAKYLKMSRIVDVSWKRMKDKLADWKVVVGKLIILPLALGSLTPALSPPDETSVILNWSHWVVVYFVIAMLAEVVLNSLEERFALQTVTWDSDKDKFTRDQDKEKRIAQLFTGLFGVVMIVALVLMLVF